MRWRFTVPWLFATVCSAAAIWIDKGPLVVLILLGAGLVLSFASVWIYNKRKGRAP